MGYFPLVLISPIGQRVKTPSFQGGSDEFESLIGCCGSRTIGSPADCDSACYGFKSRLSPLSE